MREKLRKTGIDIIGDVLWGTHLCLFYQNKEDLIDILVPYFKAGLENNEFCMWVTSEPVKVEDAKTALKKVVSWQACNDAQAFVIARPKAVAISWIMPS